MSGPADQLALDLEGAGTASATEAGRLQEWPPELQTLDEGLFDLQGCWSEMPDAWRHDEDAPADALQQSQTLQFLMLCLKGLPEKTARVFLMREYLGLDSNEITDQTGLKAGHVRIVLMRARLSLRTCMAWRMSV